jgi:glycine dehydrogenase subunit 2
VFFPLIVDQAFMIEPTEPESKETLDRFAEALERIAEEAAAHPDLLRHAPHTMPVGRVDEVKAAREPNVRFQITPSQGHRVAKPGIVFHA